MIKQYLNKGEALKLLGAVFGTLIYALGANLFIVPLGLYNGGVMGFCQLIRTLLVEYLHLPLGTFDFAGVIYYIANIPLFIIAAKKLSWFFFFKTLLCVTTMTVFLSIVPVMQAPILGDDILASCLIGGICAGCGCGLTLKMGGSGGGLDIVGLLMVRSKKGASVGRLSLCSNLVLYFICMILFNVPTAIYSIIMTVVCSFAIDKMHTQNIDVEVSVLTEVSSEEMQKEILSVLGRGITRWHSEGAYTGQSKEMLYVLLSKYEVPQLKHIVHKYDPHAFIVVNEGVSVDGNYLKKL